MTAGCSWPEIIRALLDGSDLDTEQAAWAMDEILAGQATAAQIAGFAVALRAKGETSDEVAAMAAAMLQRAELVSIASPVMDVVGTGGDHSGSVNISTMAAIAVAACGVPVIKHGNRAASSQTGTADVLSELGVAIELQPAQVARCATELGIAFAFAPVHHPAMRFAAGARRDLGVPTVFNILGPLTNPAQATAALIGCADLGRAPVMAGVLAKRGVRALVVRADDGLDEISATTTTRVWDATDGSVRQQVIDPHALGLQPAQASDLVGGDPARNAELLRMTLGLEPVPDHEDPKVRAIRDAVAINAAAALVAWESIDHFDTSPIDTRIGEQLPRAQLSLTSGRAAELLERWIKLSRELEAD